MALRCAKPMLRPRAALAARVPEKRAEPFYSTPEFRKWRAIVIGRAGGMCQWPGCGTTDGRMYADHIVERKDGGADLDPANGQCLCAGHHSVKTVGERKKRLACS